MMRIRLLGGLGILLLASGCATTADRPADFNDVLERQLAGESQLQGNTLDQAVAEADGEPLGSFENPVRAARPEGQRAYLGRLRCADGDAPRYQRTGNLGPGIYQNIVDNYRVQCRDGQQADIVMDMYHPGYVERAAVPGFTIVAP